jgi:hypothetical protein
MAINGRGRPTKAQKEDADLYRTLMGYVAKYDREFKKWEGRTEKILKRYRDEFRDGRGYDGEARFNILWSNVQTLVPATFSRLPKPDVSRRFKDQDPIGRVAGLVLERSLEFEIEHYPDYRATMEGCVYDRFLGGRGTCWARYEPHFRAVDQALPETGLEVTEDVRDDQEAETEPDEEVDYECAPTDYVHWKDFGHNVARTWEEVFIGWRKVYLTRDACIERFGEEIGKSIPLDSRPESEKENTTENEDSRALIYEMWDKSKEMAYWVNKSMGKIIDRREDPLELEGFFPFPKPLYATITNESLVPVPDFTLYQDQANELDVLCDRIDGLVKALQVKGVYNAEFTELARLFTEGSNGTMIPITNFNAFAEKQGLGGAIDLVDLTPIARALEEAYKAFEQIKSQIYEISGISDIVRGATDPNETLGAQQMKGQYASLRLGRMKQQVAQFATDLLRLKAQIIVGKFDPQTIMKMACVDQLSQQDQAMLPQAMQLLLGERAMNPDADSESPVRAFRIEIAADSLIQMDEMQEKQQRTEFVKMVGTYLKEAQPVVAAAPQLATLILELLKFACVPFKVGKSVEGIIDETADQMKQQIQQMASQPKPPSPEMMKIQADQQASQAKVQGAIQVAQAKAQADAQATQAEFAMEQQRLQMEEKMRERELQFEAHIEQQRNMMEAQRAAQQGQIDAALKRFEALMDYRKAIEVAEIGAQATLSAAQETAANTASQST